MKISKFEDLESWQQARILVNKAYKICDVKAFKNDYSLMDQLRRAAVSVPSNIAEGFVRHSDREFTQFLYVAMSSAAEVQSHLYVALDQAYIRKDQFDEVYDQASKASMLISGFIKYLSSTTKKTR